MKNNGIFSRFIGVILICVLITLPVSGAQIPQPEQNTAQVAAGSSFGIDATYALLNNDELAKNTKSIFLYEYSSQTLMYAWNADERLDPASMVKIMTALIAVEKGDFANVVVVTDEALSKVPSDAVSADLQVDELITLEELLYCMMVGSANDAASVIAEHIGGSVNAFVDMMNTRAAELGCTNTNFTNPHGIYEEQQFSTARDMARILSAAMQNELFCTVFGTVTHQVPATNKSEERDLSSGNFLMNTDEMPLYLDERVIGGRTGVAGDGTRCLAAAAENNGMSLISILMGAEDGYEEDGYAVRTFGGYKETSALFTAGFDGYKVAQILYPGQSLIQLPVQNGTSQVILSPMESVSAVLPAETNLKDLSFHYDDRAYQLAAPITKGEESASVEIWNGNTCIAAAKLCALNSVPVYSAQDSEESKDRTLSTTAILVVFTVVLACTLVFLAIRFTGTIRKMLYLRRSKRYRRSRRRSR